MEAKGCAKPATWKDARRHFYWAVRARVARSNALSLIAEADPTASYQYRSDLLHSLAKVEPDADYRQVAEAIEQLDLSPTLAQLKSDHLVHQMIQLTKEDRKAALDGFARFADTFTDEERASLVALLKSPTRSPGILSSSMTTLQRFLFFV